MAALQERLRNALRLYRPEHMDEGITGVRAAVLLLLYERAGEPHIVFQKRSEFVLHHKGQISFPGGTADLTDPDLQFTALRETHEEMGVDPDDVDVFGQLDGIATVATDFRVTPFVGWLRKTPYTFRYPPAEVAYLLEVPVRHLLDAENFVADHRTIDGVEVVLPAYRFGEDLIWGATARILTNFLDVWGTLDPDSPPPPAATLGERLTIQPRGTMQP